MTAAAWSIAGLVANLIGVVLLFRYGMPYRPPTAGGSVRGTMPTDAPPTRTVARKSLDEVDPEILRTYEKLGIPLCEQELLAGVVRQVDGREDASEARRVAVDAVFELGWLGLALIILGTAAQVVGAWLGG
jgi:hypothetical protein